MSYQQRGCVGRADAQDHAIVYTSDSPPEPLIDEDIVKRPIKVEPRNNENLTPESRVNFSKLYTVEHNLKVKNIGVVPEEWMSWVIHYYNEVHSFQ